MAFVAQVTIPSLGAGGAYALWGFRASAVGHGCCSVLIRGFRDVFGDNGTPALGALRFLARTMGAEGGRRICLAEPGCCGVTCDELSIVALLAAAQGDDACRRDAHLRWLMGGRGEDMGRAAANAVASAFREAGVLIEPPPVEIESPKANGAFPAFRTFHETGHA
jgi:hypothetical protein